MIVQSATPTAGSGMKRFLRLRKVHAYASGVWNSSRLQLLPRFAYSPKKLETYERCQCANKNNCMLQQASPQHNRTY